MTAGPPPPRPDTVPLAPRPFAAQGRPRAVTVAGWLWLLAGALAVVTVVLVIGRLDAVRAELEQAVRDRDPSAPAERVAQVVDLSVLVIVGGGLVFGITGTLLTVALRGGRRWARLTLTIVAVLVVAYGVLVYSTTGWLVLAYAAAALAATVFMYLPGGGRWFA
ncbi:hypothetical protein [Actinophytocola sp.]|uniref:hypothetical protein n=1 Tax=Actinophytocola sp. TaxID=1872138 RepID=UPI002ED69EAF